MILSYIDPGTGSMLLQILIAGLLSVGLLFKTIRYRIADVFRLVFGRKAKNAVDADPSSTSSKGDESRGADRTNAPQSDSPNKH